MDNNFKALILICIIAFAGLGAYAGATNTISIGDGNSTDVVPIVDNKDVTPVKNWSDTGSGPVETVEVIKVTDGDSPAVGNTSSGVVSGQNVTSPTVINNNNYNNNIVNVSNNIVVPKDIQPTVTPTAIESDVSLQKTEVVTEKIVAAPQVVTQKTYTIKTSDLYTGQIVKLAETQETKKGLQLTEVNTGKVGCEYVVVTNYNDYDMGLGGYTVYVGETATGIRLPNIAVGAGKSVKCFTVNGKPDTYVNGYIQKFHFRLAKELYPDSTPVNVYLMEPNFNEAISQIATTA